MARSLALAALALLLGPASALAAEVDCTFDGAANPSLVFTYLPEDGDANSEATVKDGDRVDSVLVHTGPGIVSFLDMPSDGRIMVTTVETGSGKAIHSSQGARDGTLV